MPQLPLDTSVEAEYSDGFILSETEQGDQSAYIAMEQVAVPTGEFDDDGKSIDQIVPTGPNTLNDILEKRPEAEHGKMVRFSVYYKDMRHDVDWSNLPDNARPIRFRDGFHISKPDGRIETGWSGCRFGYQYTDENGKNVKEVREL